MIICNAKEAREKIVVTQDNVRWFNHLMHSENGHGMCYLCPLDQRPYMDMLLEANVFFTAPMSMAIDMPSCNRPGCEATGGAPCGHCED